LVGTMESWDATRRVSEEGYDDRLDDACDECATGLLVRVRVPSSYVSPPASGHATGHGHGHEASSPSAHFRRPDSIRTSRTLCAKCGVLRRWTLFGSSSTRVSAASLERRVAVFLFGNTASSLYPPPSLASARAAHFRLARLVERYTFEFVGLGVAIRHSYSCTVFKSRSSKGDSTLRP
jgi:hypothetical protein